MLGCTGGATVMGFGSSASNIWHKLSPLGHLRGMKKESGWNMRILCTISNNNMVKNTIFLCVSGSLSKTSDERGHKRRGKRLKHFKERRQRMRHFSASTTH